MKKCESENQKENINFGVFITIEKENNWYINARKQ